ncbi:hypothetical protein [Microbacterium jiangjiandongii]|nr:hypothetical protein [Microbacterium sp. zg.Y843]MCR2815860.1 hypothetical protein [Microbacterium sp. zg.Y843]
MAESDPIVMIAQRLCTGSVFLINRKELPPTHPHLIHPGDLLLTAKTG